MTKTYSSFIILWVGGTPLRIILLHMPLAWAAVIQGLKWAGMCKVAHAHVGYLGRDGWKA